MWLPYVHAFAVQYLNSLILLLLALQYGIHLSNIPPKRHHMRALKIRINLINNNDKRCLNGNFKN